jgi:hypothetical protein
MGSTAHGYPYPEPTDRARGGSVAIRTLAERLETDATGDGGAVVLADSPSAFATGTQTDVTFPGAHALVGFTFDGVTLTRTGAGRYFVVHAQVSVQVTSSGASTLVTSASLLHNGVSFAESGDVVSSSAGTLTERQFVHNVTSPIYLATGETLKVRAGGAGGAGTVGSCTRRIYPAGPVDR